MIASAIITIKDLREIEVGATAPANPTENTIWIDTSVTPNLEKRWTGTAWEVINDVSSNTVVTQLSARLTTAEGDITAVVDEVWPNGTAQSSQISLNSGSITTLTSAVNGHELKITQQGSALQMDAQGNSGLATRVGVAETGISTLTSDVNGHTAAIQANAEQIGLVVADGSTSGNVALTADALSYVGNNVNLQTNNSLNIIVGNIENDITNAANTAQGNAQTNARTYTDGVASTISATQDEMKLQIAAQGDVLAVMKLEGNGLWVQTGGEDSPYKTLTDGTGFHVYQQDTEIASFANNGITAHSFTMGRVVCRKTSAGGWAWNLA